MKRHPRVLAVAQGRIPTVELAVIHPFTWLSEEGVCHFQYRDSANVSADDLYGCDVLILIRGGSERMHVLLQEAKRAEIATVGYWDDNPFAVPESSASFHSFEAMLPRIVSIMEGADYAVCSTEACAEAFQCATARRVDVLQSCPVINPLKAWNARKAAASGTIFGFAGSFDHWLVVQEMIFPALELLLKRNEVFTCEIMGPDVKVPDSLKANVVLRKPLLRYEDWLEARNKLTWNFALAPLKHSQFNRCKTPNKFLEYSAAAIPCIYSEVEPYTQIVVSGHNGLLTQNDPALWADAISKFIHDQDLRNRVAQKAWEDAQKAHGREVIVSEYKKLLEGLHFNENRLTNGAFYRVAFKTRLYWHLLSWRTFRLKMMSLWAKLFN